jgi:hypothetical protein
MNKQALALVVNFFVFLSFPATAEESDLSKAVFAADERQMAIEDRSFRGLGVVTNALSGWGIAYHQSLASQRRIWTELVYTGEMYFFEAGISKSSEPVLTRSTQKNKFELLVGVDEIFHATSNKYWGFVVGLGAGLARREFQIKSFGPLCSWICGYDTAPFSEKAMTDSYALLQARLGLIWLDVKVLGLRGDGAFLISPQLARYPQIQSKLESEGHLTKEATSQSPFHAEAIVQF